MHIFKTITKIKIISLTLPLMMKSELRAAVVTGFIAISIQIIARSKLVLIFLNTEIKLGLFYSG